MINPEPTFCNFYRRAKTLSKINFVLIIPHFLAFRVSTYFVKNLGSKQKMGKISV